MVSPKTFAFTELTELGFKTFNNYLPYKDYALIEDPEIKYFQTLENVRAFPKILQDRREEISADIEHNYNLCISLNLQTIEQLKEISSDFLNELKLTEKLKVAVYSYLDNNLYINYKKREKILLEEKEIKLFIEKYNSIKAEQWPKIHNRTDFYALSDEIRRECREVFNFPWPIIEDFIS